VPGSRQVLRPRRGIDRDLNRRRAIGCGDSRSNSFTGIDRNSEGGTQEGGVVGDLSSQVQFVTAVFSQRQADQAAREAGHEVNNLGRCLFGGAHKIALILAILVVNDDDHVPVAYLGDGIFN